MMVSTDVPSKLQEIIQTYGRDVVQDPKRVEGLLRDLCGARTREINLLPLAVRENVAADLSAQQTRSLPHELLLARLKKRLEDNHGMASDAAAWAVETWAVALGVITISLSPEEQTKANASLLELWTNRDGAFDFTKARSMTLAQVRQALDGGANVTVTTKNGETALMAAACCVDLDVAEFLIAQGLSTAVKDNDDWTALMYAANDGRPDCIALLIAKGAAVDAKRNDGWTALMAAASRGHADCARLPVVRGADVNAKRNTDDLTALMAAAEAGHVACAEVLITKGAHLAAKRSDGLTALMFAERNRHHDLSHF